LEKYVGKLRESIKMWKHKSAGIDWRDKGIASASCDVYQYCFELVCMGPPCGTGYTKLPYWIGFDFFAVPKKKVKMQPKR
jgi:hypothetical protein